MPHSSSSKGRARVGQKKPHDMKGSRSGLGTAFVKNVLARHGGTISTNSVPADGSTFTVILPAAARGPAGSGGEAHLA